jgi:hypothetical protein
MAAGRDHPLGGLTLGLLHESPDHAHLDRRVELDPLSRLDVAEPGVRSRGRDPERHEVTSLGRGRRRDQHLAELPAFGDDMV